MYKQLIENQRVALDKSMEHFATELASIRTGRAAPAMVENIAVESYGVVSPLKNIASITVPEPKSLTIQPWDRSLLSNIEKAIMAANLGIQPINDGLHVRLNLPPLNEERRKDLAKVVRQQAEAARVRVRNIREDIWKEVVRLQKEKKVTEDQKYEAQEELKKLVEEYNEKIGSLLERKEQEIMTV